MGFSSRGVSSGSGAGYPGCPLEVLERLYVGAEAEITLCRWLGETVVVKTRRPKRYRHSILDQRVTRARTVHEALMLREAREAGVLTPIVYHVNPVRGVIIMQHVEGENVSRSLPVWPGEKALETLEEAGRSVGRLHGNGMVHGDPTTSNMILRDGDLFIVDFGLSSHSRDVEQFSEDVYVTAMALGSLMPEAAHSLFEAFTEGYAGERGASEASRVFGRMREVAKRGRYVERGFRG